ncbi:hypothetical protein EEJ33_16875 [Vibrio cholerae]|nr:hypothetical protein EEJ33_16875 [Vibrio cholerae]
MVNSRSAVCKSSRIPFGGTKTYFSFIAYSLLPNARLRGGQRITTKLKHNNRNHRGSLGLETPRVDSPS